VAISERRLRRSPLRDVAGMIRSFHYAAHAALLRHIERVSPPPARSDTLAAWGQFWAVWVAAVFFGAYRKAAGPAKFLPAGDADLELLVNVFLLRKAIYELGYELNNRPGWVSIPVQAILNLVPAPHPRPAGETVRDTKTP